MYTNDIRVYRGEMKKFLGNGFVDSSILDVWSVWLNYNEKFKNKASLCRMFAPTHSPVSITHIMEL